jgi:hypothetical protein
MGNGEQSGSGGRADWRVRLATAVGAGAGAALGLLVKSLGVDLGGFWPGMIAFGVVVGVGTVLGRLAGSLLFRRPPDR